MQSPSGLKLEVPEKEHLSFLVRMANQGGLRQFAHSKKRVAITNFQPPEKLLVITAAGNPVGVLEILRLDLVSRRAEISFALEEVLTTAVLDLALAYCFSHLNLNKVSMLALATEQELIETIKSRNFKQEVRWRQHFFSKGNYCSVIEFGLLRDEYL